MSEISLLNFFATKGQLISANTADIDGQTSATGLLRLSFTVIGVYISIHVTGP
jgi:hypothetical protein